MTHRACLGLHRLVLPPELDVVLKGQQREDLRQDCMERTNNLQMLCHIKQGFLMASWTRGVLYNWRAIFNVNSKWRLLLHVTANIMINKSAGQHSHTANHKRCSQPKHVTELPLAEEHRQTRLQPIFFSATMVYLPPIPQQSQPINSNNSQCDRLLDAQVIVSTKLLRYILKCRWFRQEVQMEPNRFHIMKFTATSTREIMHLSFLVLNS